MILRGVQFRLTGLPAWQSGQPGQVGNQAALTVEPVPGSRLVTLPLPFAHQCEDGKTCPTSLISG